MTATGSSPAVRMTAIHKRFGAVQANRDAHVEIAAGEIHAIVGENGAGKSTLMKILAGVQGCDAGTIEVHGRDVTGWQTAEAIAAGVAMVHQHFMLVPTLTVAENVVLGSEPRAGVRFDRVAALARVQQLCAETGLSVPADRLVADLSVGEAQRVEILKTLYRGAKVLLLDEPTAVLSPPEVRDLWQVLRRVRDQGATIVLVTHKLDEVMDVTDRITVMRQGQTVGVLQTRETTPEAIAHAMVGRAVDLAVQQAETRTTGPADKGLRIDHLVVAGARIARAVDDVSLVVAPGEIVGIAGVEGNGQTELLEAIAGLRPVTSGTIALAGTDITQQTVRARGDLGLSHIPEDRHVRGLLLDFSIADNLILGQQHRFTQRGVIDRQAVRTNALQHIGNFDIRPTDPNLAVRGLSGGNQQKVVIARELSRDFKVLLAAQPTRGVDVGAIEFIHGQLRKARDDGKAVLLVSAELREILTLSDRIAVLFGGRIVAVMSRAEASEDVLGPWMTGAGPSHSVAPGAISHSVEVA